MKNKKLDVHIVQHTHWDREWYFASDDSKVMLHFNMKYIISYLEKYNHKFTFDGQTSIIDDFIKYAPHWKERLKKVITSGKLLVGPFYTQTDNVIAHGESIVRNLEIGQDIAKKYGKNMAVGYLPDTFGHNNQTPQILKMNGINNLSFYRGLDPDLTNDNLYFWYQGLDQSKVLAHWQTHYSTHWKAFSYDYQDFSKYVVEDYEKQGEFYPSVKSYAKRNSGLPIAIPIGTDQKPLSPKLRDLVKQLNTNYDNFNFIISDYQTLIKDIYQQIKDDDLQLPVVEGELRQALTGRVHRSVISSRLDVKQLHFKLEDLLVNVLEPLAVMSYFNNINVPWTIIENVWKKLFKSSAHDSYGTTNEDHVNQKIKQRLIDGLRIANSLAAMLSQFLAHNLVAQQSDLDCKMVVFNFNHLPYQGAYQIEVTLKRGFEEGQFKIYDQDQEIPYVILDKNNVGTHERNALTLLLKVPYLPAFGYRVYDLRYSDKEHYGLSQNNVIKNQNLEIKVENQKIFVKHKNQQYCNLFKFVFASSVGDTYDHSPLKWDEKIYELDKLEIIETNVVNQTIKLKAQGLVPSGIENWKNEYQNQKQSLTFQLTIIDDQIHCKILVKNQVFNGQLRLLVKTLSESDFWFHDQQFGIYQRQLNNKYLKTWKEPNKTRYLWQEYPTNLSPHQSFINNFEQNFTIFTSGTREHEMIEINQQKYFAITLYRATSYFGKDNLLYRPGRASGALCEAKDGQMIDQQLTYDLIFDFNNLTNDQKFESARQLQQKAHYIPGQWGLSRTILRWEPNDTYLKNGFKNPQKTPFDQELKQKKLVLSSLYRSPQKQIIARFLNLGKEVILKNTHLKSRTLTNFSKKPISVPQYGLINILLEKER